MSRSPLASSRSCSQQFACCVLVSAFVAAALGASPRPATAQTRTVSFQPHHEFGTAGAPNSVALADLNGDGKLDLATANSGDSTVSVLLGNGDGTFATRHDYITGRSPFSVAVGDLNGDGRVDLVTANYYANTISVLLGNGDGTFGSRSDFGALGSPGPLVIGDFNGDGKPDLVLSWGDGVAVMLGNGNGTFTAVTDSTSGGEGGGPHCLATGDFNGDGKLDVAATNPDYYRSNINVRLGNGNGTFLGKGVVATGSSPVGIVAGDFNGDGKLDLAVANSNSNSISVLLGNGDGTFGSRRDFGAGNSPHGIAASDFNGDGKLDLAVTNSGDGTVSLFLGNGGGYFWTRVDVPVASGPNAVAIGDFNGDGRPDLAVTSGTNAVSVLLQNPWTTTTLSSSANPSVFGQSVTLTATVTPSAASGAVQFFDNGYLLGSAPLAGGTAALTVTSLTGGSHSLTATYAATTGYGGSASPPLSQAVGLAGTTTALSASVNPSVFREAVSFTATVAPLSPGIGVPAGAVQFRIDSTDYGTPVVLGGGVATSPSIATLSVGGHSIQARYLGPDTLRFSTSSSSVLTQTVQPSQPTIVSVRDVPHDQGGRVFVTWHFTLDQPGIQLVTGYRVWRRVPDTTPATSNFSPTDARPASASTRPLCRKISAVMADSSVKETFWEAIADLPAAQLVSYGYTAPTTQDSIAGSNPYTAFFVEALTADPFVFFDSAPDSGYSVDNLAPLAPAPFAGNYSGGATHLHWNPNSEADLAGYRLYRGSSASFVPGPGNLLAAKADTGYADVGQAGAYYRLAAVDIHGNESADALLTPSQVSGVWGDGALAFALEGASPNPASGHRLSVVFALSSAAPARLELIDVAGRLITEYEVGGMGAGRHVVDLAADRRIAPGLYLVRLTQGSSTRVVHVVALD